MISASTPSDLAKVAGTARAPLLIDVRREEIFKAADEMISVSACVRRLLFRSLAADGTVARWPEPADPARDREAAA